MKLKVFVTLLLALTCVISYCEITDTVISIKQVEAKGIRFGKYTLGAKVFTIDTATLITYKSGSIADLLASRSLISVNSYGPEGMASISMRGGSSRHTAIIWNGFNIRNPASGGINFSALPAGFVDAISLQSGGSSTMYGSGASTGTIFLSDNLNFSKSKYFSNLNLEGGSFGTYSLFGSIGHLSPGFSTRLKIGYQNSENNFRFKNTQKYGHPVVALKHAAYSRFSYAWQNAIKTGKNSQLGTDFWYSALNKDIPTLMSDTKEGVAFQNDKSYRMAANYSSYHANWSLKLRSGFFSDDIQYFDSLTMDEKSRNKSVSFINEAEGRINAGARQNLNIGLNHTYELAASDGYIADTGRNRFSIFGRYNYSLLFNKLTFSIEGRKEVVQNEKVPFVYSVSGVMEILSGLSVKSVFSKHYSLPVFDDLFWAEDAFAKGNPNLKPEYGYNKEIGIEYKFQKNEFMIENEITFYQNNIHDLIIWLPDSTSKYTPTNFKDSDTKGIEITGNINKKWGENSFWLNYMYGFTDALIFDNPDDHEGSQRFYVPKHKANVSVGISIKRFQFIYSQTFNSKRYIDQLNTLPAYVVSDMQLKYFLQMKTVRCSAFLKIKNLFNTSYQVMNGYAQPLRNYSIGINLNI